MLGNPALAAAMGTAARRRCEAVFATEVVGDRLLECYADAIGAGSMPRARELELQ
jgi:hypothetical protein